VVLLLVGYFQVLVPILGMAGVSSSTSSRDVRIDDATRSPGVAISGSVTFRGSGHAELVYTNPSVGQRVELALPHLVNGILIIVILAILLRIAHTFRDGDFFAPQNVWRLFVVVGALGLMAFVVPLLDMMTTNLLARGLPVTKAVAPAKDYAVQPLFLAFLVAIVAEAFRAGTRLRADTEGLV
jgi:hypothetical protein